MSDRTMNIEDEPGVCVEAGASTAPAAAASGPRLAGKRLIQDYLSMAGFNALSIGMSFLNTSALLSLLGRADYGAIVGYTSLALLISLFATEWTAPAAIRFGTEEYLEDGHVSSTFWNRLFVIAVCLGVFLPLMLAGERLFGTYLGFTRFSAVFLTIYLPLSVYWVHIQRFLPAMRRHRLLYPLLFLERSLVLCAIGACHFVDRLSVVSVLGGYVFGSLAAGGLATFLVRHEIGRPHRPERAKVLSILNFSWPMLPSIWVGALSTNALDYLLVHRYVGAAQLGVYSLGVQIAGIVQQLPQIAGTIAAPRIVGLRLQDDGTRLRRFVQRDFVLGQWCWVALCFVSAGLVSWQGPNWIPPSYGLLTKLVWPLAMVTTLLPMWYIVWSPILTAFEKTRTIMWAGVATGSMNLAANLALIPRFGAIGSAWASALAFMTSILVAELLVSRAGDVEIPQRGLAFYAPSIMMAIVGLAALAWS